MAFKINDMDFADDYIEGYSSGIESDTLRINCVHTITAQEIDSIKRCHNELPTIVIEPASCLDRKGCKTIEIGDVLRESVRLDRKSVKLLIKELKRWLRKEE